MAWMSCDDGPPLLFLSRTLAALSAGELKLCRGRSSHVGSSSLAGADKRRVVVLLLVLIVGVAKLHAGVIVCLAVSERSRRRGCAAERGRSWWSRGRLRGRWRRQRG